MTERFLHQRLYFRVTYLEPGNYFPSIEGFVYVGKNLSDEDEDDTWYFQPSADYSLRGSILESKSGDRPVVCANAKDAAFMLDIEGLKVEMDAAQRRWRNGGS